MFITKKVNVFISLNEIKQYIQEINRDTKYQLIEILNTIKDRDEDLVKEYEARLNRKHIKRITKKEYLHVPTSTAADEIAKKELQEMIYQMGVEEITSILKSATEHKI